MTSIRPALGLLLPLGIIVIIVMAGFGRTLSSYFLEDDFGEVHYVSQIFAGDWEKFASNFTGNYMQIQTMRVYRPVLLLSIMLDYAIWKTHAIGYFITNIAFLIADAFILYLLLRQLTMSWLSYKSIAFAAFAACLFAAGPLHCESVSLMVGRVDIICLFFYLLALSAFIRRGRESNWQSSLLGLIFFWLALLTKEMAIGLPVLLSAMYFLFPDLIANEQSQQSNLFGGRKSSNIVERCKMAFKMAFLYTWPLWLSLLPYFIIRRLALGTFFGGYVGSIGASQYQHIFEKWLDPDTITRIIFPFNQAVFSNQNIYHSLLADIYIALVLLVILRICLFGMPWSWLALLFVWLATTLAPIYQLWGLGFNLEGARFLFFMTVPLAISLPALIFAPAQGRKQMDLLASQVIIKRSY